VNDPRQEREDTPQSVASAPAAKAVQGGEMGVAPLEVTNEDGYRELRARPQSGLIQYGRFTAPVPGRGDIEITLGYRRCLDFDSINGAGQDFALVRVDKAHGMGVVADGVSQSFFGDIAARRVSLFLARVLWESRMSPPSPEALEEALHDLETDVSEEVKHYTLPTHLPDMQVAALERARSRGSQTVFAAFVLDLKSGALNVYMLGDADAVVRLSEGNVAPKRDAKGRWSSAGNSRYALKWSSFRTCEGIMLKSDGAGEAWGQNLDERDAVCERAFVQLARDQASKDDVAFIGVNLSGSSPESGPTESTKRHYIPETPAPRPVETKALLEIRKRESAAGTATAPAKTPTAPAPRPRYSAGGERETRPQPESTTRPSGETRLSNYQPLPVREVAIVFVTGIIVGCALTLWVLKSPAPPVGPVGTQGQRPSVPAPRPQVPPPRPAPQEPGLHLEQQELSPKQFAQLDKSGWFETFGQPDRSAAKVRIVLDGLSADSVELQPANGDVVNVPVPRPVRPGLEIVNAAIPCNSPRNAKVDVRLRIPNQKGIGHFTIQPYKFYQITVQSAEE
jgi:hypothetical protein